MQERTEDTMYQDEGARVSDQFLSRQRVLVIAPHPDDETYGCAGTIARIKSLGGQVYVLVGSVGRVDHYASHGDVKVLKTVGSATRLAEIESVTQFLKVDDWEVLFDDDDIHLALDAVPRKELVRLIERDAHLSIERVEPTMMLIPAISYNQDHEALFRASMTATRPGLRTERHFVPYILAYDSPTLSWAPRHEQFDPNVFIDISDFLDVKLEAMRRHRSQVRDPLFCGSPESIELQAHWRGREVSISCAESFEALRMTF